MDSVVALGMSMMFALVLVAVFACVVLAFKLLSLWFQSRLPVRSRRSADTGELADDER